MTFVLAPLLQAIFTSTQMLRVEETSPPFYLTTHHFHTERFRQDLYWFLLNRQQQQILGSKFSNHFFLFLSAASLVFTLLFKWFQNALYISRSSIPIPFPKYETYLFCIALYKIQSISVLFCVTVYVLLRCNNVTLPWKSGSST